MSGFAPAATDVLTTLELKDGDLVVRSFQDVEDIIERNKRLRSESQKSDWGRHVASIPNNILLQWMLEEGVPVFGMPIMLASVSSGMAAAGRSALSLRCRPSL